MDVTGADDEPAAGREEADDGVVALVTKDIAEFAPGAWRLGVSIGDFEQGDLTGVDAGPAGVVQALTIEVGARGAVDGLGVGKEIEEGDGITNEAFDHFVVDGVTKLEDRRVDVLFDGPDLAFCEAFVGVGGGEMDTEGVLCPELSGTADECRLLIPGESFRGSAIATPHLNAIPDGTGDLHGALIA